MGWVRSAILPIIVMLVMISIVLSPAAPLQAADHGDAPLAGNDRGADLNDVYLFLDPTDNSNLILIMTVHGFIARARPNFGIFDPSLRYRFEIENTDDARADGAIDIRFSPRVADAANVPLAQTATIICSTGGPLLHPPPTPVPQQRLHPRPC